MIKKLTIPLLYNLALILLLMLSPATHADTAGANFVNYQNLSTENRKIADALHSSQYQSSGIINQHTHKTPVSRDELAFAWQKSKSWGTVFNQLKNHGLIREKTLGEVLANHHEYFISHSGETRTNTGPGYSDIVITTGAGDYIVVGRHQETGSDAILNELF